MPEIIHFITWNRSMMLSEQILIQKFAAVSEERCPQLGELLNYCHVELVNSHWGQPAKLMRYFVVYYPNMLFASISDARETLRLVAQDLGISDAVCMNATRVIRDPKSTLKQKDPVLWLELLWIAASTSRNNWLPNPDLQH